MPCCAVMIESTATNAPVGLKSARGYRRKPGQQRPRRWRYTACSGRAPEAMANAMASGRTTMPLPIPPDIVPDLEIATTIRRLWLQQCNHGNMLPARSICNIATKRAEGINGADPRARAAGISRTSGGVGWLPARDSPKPWGYPAKMPGASARTLVPGGESDFLDSIYAAADATRGWRNGAR